jgi:hypothetical protein
VTVSWVEVHVLVEEVDLSRFPIATIFERRQRDEAPISFFPSFD